MINSFPLHSIFAGSYNVEAGFRQRLDNTFRDWLGLFGVHSPFWVVFVRIENCCGNYRVHLVLVGQ